MSEKLYLPAQKSVETKLIAERIDTITRALPPGIVPQQFIVAVFSELNALAAERQKKRQDPLFPDSVVKAVFNCAVLGLIPGSVLGQAYFVPFKNKQRNRIECQLIVGYRGYLDLAYGCNFLCDIHPEVVLAGEKFRQWNNADGPQLEHEIPLERELDRRNVIGAYCTYHTVSGGHGMAVVNRKQLDAIDTEDGVWQTDYIPMAKKTPMRRAAKEWRITHRLGLALRLDDQADNGEEQEADVTFDAEAKQFSLKDIPVDDAP